MREWGEFFVVRRCRRNGRRSGPASVKFGMQVRMVGISSEFRRCGNWATKEVSQVQPIDGTHDIAGQNI